ncbi:T9SS type A sorting domain-containing protein [Barnesiella propionica]|uniref:T9SS type A sorting domain-containing protein n=1 Tax=Barnesiella propionica TaxID=2981781 RepID=UPI001431D33A|nr:T9SS type A sorting domain-containing protein [Barnesiella propionica]MCU6769705.1 T9SS type A sorting domain-containing protein [Barnesiella propionica]
MRTLITSLALCAAMATQAADAPKTVTWEILKDCVTNGNLPMTQSGQLIWGDYNNDGLLDAYISAGTSDPVSGLFKNNGDGTFTEVTFGDQSMFGLASAVFFDYNNDGNLDLLVTGSMDGTATTAVMDLYRNTGAPDYDFELVDISDVVAAVSSESGDNGTRMLEAVDYDNDGWVDLFVNGNAGGIFEGTGSSRVVALFRNNHGTFELVNNPVNNGTEQFLPVNGGSIHCADVNNDGFVDLIVSGYHDDMSTITDLYLNDGKGGFTRLEDSHNIFKGHQQGETFFADVNNDGWMDIIEIGRDVKNGWASFASMYINNKDNTFTALNEAETNLIGGGACAAVGDINNDGLVDLFVCGWGPNATFFYNNGNNSFTPVAIDPDAARARSGCASFVDFNNDNNLDMAIFGYRDNGSGTPEDPTWPDFFLQNKLGDGIASNQKPTAPGNATFNYSEDHYILSWDKSTDDTTPKDAIRYNVLVKSDDGTVFSYVPAAENGFVKVGGMRAFIMTNSFRLNIPQGNYTFMVQAIDNANAASEFVQLKDGASVGKINADDNVRVWVNGKSVKINNAGDKALSYTIVSANGQTVSAGECAAYDDSTVSLSDGVYVVRVTTAAGVSAQKVIIF